MNWLIIPILLITSSCFASFTVEWGYTPPSQPAVSGFKLYKSGVLYDQFLGNVSSGVSNKAITKEDSFTLTATFVDGTESPMSSPFVYQGTTQTPIPVPIIKSITINP